MPEDDPFDVVALKFDRRGAAGVAVLLSTLMILEAPGLPTKGRPSRKVLAAVAAE
jgi:hypothetical protein